MPSRPLQDDAHWQQAEIAPGIKRVPIDYDVTREERFWELRWCEPESRPSFGRRLSRRLLKTP